MSFCHSEVVAYTDYVSNLAGDEEPGRLTAGDLLMLAKSYACDSETNGKYTVDLMCFRKVINEIGRPAFVCTG